MLIWKNYVNDDFDLLNNITVFDNSNYVAVDKSENNIVIVYISLNVYITKKLIRFIILMIYWLLINFMHYLVVMILVDLILILITFIKIKSDETKQSIILSIINSWSSYNR